MDQNSSQILKIMTLSLMILDYLLGIKMELIKYILQKKIKYFRKTNLNIEVKN